MRQDGEQTALIDTQLRPVILCGGVGSRLWPVSRALHPKQLADFGEPASLLQDTLRRVDGAGFAAPILVGGEEHRFLIRDQLSDIGMTPSCIILEAERRNTAPAIAVAAELVCRDDPDELLLILPSDHLVDDQQAFVRALGPAVREAESGRIALFGIAPTRAEPAYGYIKPALPPDGGAAPVAHFVEKPPLSEAEGYFRSGEYLWNSGILVARAGVVRDAIDAHAPDVAAWAKAAVAAGSEDDVFFRPAEPDEASCPNVSIACAVLELSDGVGVVPVEMRWSDLGSWMVLWEREEKDPSGNALRGQAVTVDTGNSLIHAYDGMTVGTVGIQDAIVVATRDAVLVAPRSRAEDVRNLVDALHARGSDVGEAPSVVHRPWGTYQVTDVDERFQTKRIVVKPGAKLSSQLHHHRSEHWVVVSGTAEVTVGEKTFLLHENQSTYISAGTVHRLANPGRVPLHLIEVQCGSYLGEDDIVRFDDVYGRS